MELPQKISPLLTLDITLILLLWSSQADAFGKRGVYAQPTVQILPAGDSKEINLRENENIVLTCVATGHPKPKLQWYITGGELGRRSLDFTDPVLSISSIKRTESSRVNCVAENRFGTLTATTRLNVLYLDQPAIRLYISKSDPVPNNSIWYENTVVLRCETRSNPRAEITWFKSEQPIKLSLAAAEGYEIRRLMRTSRDNTAYILKIRNAAVRNYGNYECKASLGVSGRRYEIPDLKAGFTFNSNATEPKIELTSAATIYADAGDAVRFECRVTAGSPNPTVTWIRDVDMSPRKSIVVSNNRIALDLVNVQKRDAGAYFCVANNNVGNPVKKQVTLIVRYLESMQYWITPDPLRDDRRLALNFDVKLTCHANAQPISELKYTWYKKDQRTNKDRPLNPRRLKSNVFITHLREADVRKFITFPASSSRLEIRKMTSEDLGVYVCEARLTGAPNGTKVERAAITVRREAAPSQIYPANGDTVVAREGSRVSLNCKTTGYPKPRILWLRDGNATAPTDNSNKVLTQGDGYLITNVSRDDADVYTCIPARVNGFSKLAKGKSKADIELVVNYPPDVEPRYAVIRKGLGVSVTLACVARDAQPFGNFKYRWTKGDRLMAQTDNGERLQFTLKDSLDYGIYICEISNEVGSSRCVINVTGAAYPPEFYYRPEDSLTISSTASSLFPQGSSPNGVFLFLLSWTQKYPHAVDPVLEYRIRWRKIDERDLGGQSTTVTPWREGCKTMDGTVEYGNLIMYEMRDLAAGSYEAAVTPLTIFGEGETAYRTINARKKSGPQTTLRGPSYFCSFDDADICSFMQEPSSSDKKNLLPSDDFDWTWNYARNLVRRTQDTGPEFDNTNMVKEGGYMYIESSNTQKGDKARLVSPMFWDATSHNQCLKFFYHMKGDHIGTLRVFQRGNGKPEEKIWSRSREQGDTWLSDSITLTSPSSYQIVFEAEILDRNGYMGDIAIDDVLLTDGSCPTPSATTPAAVVKTLNSGNGARSVYQNIAGDVTSNWFQSHRHLQASLAFLLMHSLVDLLLAVR